MLWRMTTHIPAQPKNSFRVILNVTHGPVRLDTVLMEALRAQDQNPLLKALSRANFKELFKDKRIQIKGQNTKPASEIAKGTTYVDILGFASNAE